MHVPERPENVERAMERESCRPGHPGGDDGGGSRERPEAQARQRPRVQRLLVHAIVLETLLGGACAAGAPKEVQDHARP